MNALLKTKWLLGRVLALMLVVAVAVTCMVSVGAATDTTESTLPAGNWTLLEAASDEFNGTQLDESKWNNGIWYDVSTDLAFKEDNVTVQDGNLVITAKKEAYNDKEYTIGAVESKFDIPGATSYVEVRAKVLDSKANVLSAIWMQSSPLTEENNPNPEIDIMESFKYDRIQSTLHTWSETDTLGEVHLQTGVNYWNTPCDDISETFHTYGLERADGKLRFYFDGELMWETKSLVENDAFVNQARHLVLSLEGHNGTPVDEYLPSDYLIDYVRTYVAAEDAPVDTSADDTQADASADDTTAGTSTSGLYFEAYWNDNKVGLYF